MPKVLEKVERRLGEKLFLKGERCTGPKCAFIRKGYPPGAQGRSAKKGRRKKRALSEYGSLLREKQKVRFLYGLDDRDTRRYTKEAALKPGIFSLNLFRLLERRLDNVVFRLGFGESRRQARSFVAHGHIKVNDRTINIASYAVKKGDLIALKESLNYGPWLSTLELKLKKYEPPAWLHLDKDKKAGSVIGYPESEGTETALDITKIKELYSR